MGLSVFFFFRRTPAYEIRLSLVSSEMCMRDSSQGDYFCTGNHNYRKADFGLRYGSITIGSGAWIEAQAVLAPGVQIGADAVVALAAVVLKDVPANTPLQFFITV